MCFIYLENIKNALKPVFNIYKAKFSHNMGHLTLPGGPNIASYNPTSNAQFMEYLLDSGFFNLVSNSKKMFFELVFATFSIILLQ